MRQRFFLLITTMLVVFVGSSAVAATTQNREITVKNAIVKEDLTQSTKVVKKSKGKKIVHKAKQPDRVVASVKSKTTKNKTTKKKANRTLAQNTKAKKYWSVECRQGFIKDSYVYCAKKGSSVAKTSKKPAMKRALAKSTVMKRAPASVRK